MKREIRTAFITAPQSAVVTVEIKHRWIGNTLFTCTLPADIAALPAAKQLGFAVKEARKAGADLSGAYLRGADLSGAYLRGAYLRGADLSGADLSGADLSDAYLRDAYLRDADLSGADLRDADLSGADLSGADLSGADLSGAIGAPDNLSEATAETPEQRREREAARAARFRERFPDTPVIEGIDAKILVAVEAKPELFDMRDWHGDTDAGPTCETTHCRAGWAVHLAGEAGYALESRYDAAYAGRIIYLASAGYVPDFYTNNEAALADIKARAAEQVQS
jgi:hypothetical protein